MTTVKFTKYQGIGNDFIIIDSRHHDLYEYLSNSETEIVSNICNRRFGVGADGVILLLNSDNGSNARMEIFNSDGSIAEMCGNGIRCLVNYIKQFIDIDLSDTCTIQTLAGNLEASLTSSGKVKINMGNPTFTPSEIPTKLKSGVDNIPCGNIDIGTTTLKVYSVSMGNPHLITYVDDLETIPFEVWGYELEKNHNFPNKTNVHFAQIINSNTVKIKIWERACGPTLACGTGACAVLAVTALLGRCSEEATILLPGGKLYIKWPDKNGPIYMSGPAEFVFNGTIDLSKYT